MKNTESIEYTAQFMPGSHGFVFNSLKYPSRRCDKIGFSGAEFEVRNELAVVPQSDSNSLVEFQAGEVLF